MRTILFRLDYGDDFGGGHLSRCLILAKHLQRENKIIFNIQLKNSRNIYTCKKLIKKKLNKRIIINFFEKFNPKKELKLNLKLNKLYNIKKFIFDFSNHEKVRLKKKLVPYFKKLKKFNKNLYLIDSLGQESLASKTRLDILALITPYLGAKKNSLYKRHFYGGKYYVIDFKNKKKKNIRKEVKNILISNGQSDHKKITHKVLKILSSKKELFRKIKINVIIGNDFKINYIKELTNIKNKNLKDLKISFIKNCSNLSNYIFQSDISLISTGLTKYECIFYNSIPVIISFDNLSEKLQKKFQIFKSSIYLGQIKYIKNYSLINCMKNLIEKYNLRKNLINNGLKIFDGKGTKRVIKILSYEKK